MGGSELVRRQRSGSASRCTPHSPTIHQLICLTSPLNPVTRITQSPDQRPNQITQRKQDHHRPDAFLFHNILPHCPPLHASLQHAAQQRAPHQHRHVIQQSTRPRHPSKPPAERQFRT